MIINKIYVVFRDRHTQELRYFSSNDLDWYSDKKTALWEIGNGKIVAISHSEEGAKAVLRCHK